jgi:purine-binding chemotaxis protein CheW
MMRQETMEQLFASFMLDQAAGLEIALRAEDITEATPIKGGIQTLPASIDFLEGIMHLRDDVIPIINLKKRLGLTENSYGTGAKIAVITLFNNRYGLLFDDIKEVFRVDQACIRPLNSALQSEDRIISSLITLEKGKRTVEVLELSNLFSGEPSEAEKFDFSNDESACDAEPAAYSRYIVFCCAGQEYGVPVQYSQEITFYSDINKMFKTGCVEGALQLRGNTIPVINSQYMLSEREDTEQDIGETFRILVLSFEKCTLGMIVEEVKEIVTIPDKEILPMPLSGNARVSGIYPRKRGGNIMLLDMPGLVCDHMEKIKSLARINNKKEEAKEERLSKVEAHHLITENCYLVFAIEKNFAIEIKDVQEIIESDGVMGVPGVTGFNSQVINLRGQIVPVINLRLFYNFPKNNTGAEKSKLIICKGQSRTVALEVDRIVTIYKQEQFHSTPSLNPQLAGRKDTLDRLIDFVGREGLSEHVLVVNTDNLVQNHLEVKGDRDALSYTDNNGIDTTATIENMR